MYKLISLIGIIILLIYGVFLNFQYVPEHTILLMAPIYLIFEYHPWIPCLSLVLIIVGMILELYENDT